MDYTHHSEVIKYCPHCGDSNFFADSGRSFKCKKCGFHFFINSAAAVAGLIFNEEGELLLSLRAIEPFKGKLDLPGGFVDPGESAEDALIRELKEELGLKVKSLSYYSSAPNEYIFSKFKVFTTDLAFKVIAENVDNLVARDDISAFQFYKLNDINFDELPAKSMQYFVTQLIKENG